MTLCEWKQPVSGPPFSGLCLRLPHPSRPPSKAKHSNRTVGGRDAPSWDPHLSKGPISSLLTPGPPFPFTSPPFSTLRIHRAPPPTQLLFAQQDHQPDGGLGPRLPPKIGLLAVLCSSAFGGSLLPWDHSTRFPWGCLLPPPPTGLLHTPGVTLSLPPHFLTLPQLSELLFTLQWSHSSAPPGSLPDAPRLVSPRPPVPSENCKRLMSVLHGLRVFPAGRVLPTSSPTPSTWHGEATAPLWPRFLQSQTRASASAHRTPSIWATTSKGGTGGPIRAGSESGASDTARASPRLGLHPPHTCAQEAAGAGQTQYRWAWGQRGEGAGGTEAGCPGHGWAPDPLCHLLDSPVQGPWSSANAAGSWVRKCPEMPVTGGSDGRCKDNLP